MGVAAGKEIGLKAGVGDGGGMGVGVNVALAGGAEFCALLPAWLNGTMVEADVDRFGVQAINSSNIMAAKSFIFITICSNLYRTYAVGLKNLPGSWF